MNTVAKPIGLALSGGGYRAVLFTLGSLWRLNELGLLKKIDCITSVSGSSIISAYLAINWSNLQFNQDDVALNFEEVIAKPLQSFCSKPLDLIAIALGMGNPRKTIGNYIADLYAKRLFKDKTLADIPSSNGCPKFIFYATSMQTGVSVRFSQRYISEYTLGKINNPKTRLATVVAASSAFPPFLSPVKLKVKPSIWESTKMSDEYKFERIKGGNIELDEQLHQEIVLTDGGVYDNLGLEALTKGDFQNDKKDIACDTVLCCDAGAPFKEKSRLYLDWMNQALRANSVIFRQTQALRKRNLIDCFKDLDNNGKPRRFGGTYWGIATDIDDYGLSNSMVKDNEITKKLRNTRTRLNSFSKKEQGQLINWGYALTDTAIRRWVINDGTLKPGVFPMAERLE